MLHCKEYKKQGPRFRSMVLLKKKEAGYLKIERSLGWRK